MLDLLAQVFCRQDDVVRYLNMPFALDIVPPETKFILQPQILRNRRRDDPALNASAELEAHAQKIMEVHFPNCISTPSEEDLPLVISPLVKGFSNLSKGNRDLGWVGFV